ncbi:MAG TPA: hypothetical protein VI547_04890, partial [Anaerolineales bacterium]|nr:hypothetical protein [Anaerolineales bacterium]
MTGVRKEAFSWFITVLVAIVTGLVIVQLAVTLAFAAQDHSPLEVAALRQRVLDYSADDASAPQLEALDAAIVEEAAEEDSALTRANDERGVLNLPTEPPAAPNLINLLLASPTSVPTLVFENPATVTPIATNTSAASPTSITATATPLASATFTPVAQSATATPSAPPILASVTLLASTHTRTATSSATATRTAQANVTLPANTNTRTATSSATATNTTTLPTNIATASATLTRTPTATFTNTVPPTLPADVNVRLNFQPAGASVPAGYGVDSGASFGDRGNGWQYGWNQTNGTAVDRNSNLSPDQRFDTVMAMQDGGWLEWNIAVPNGVYTVHIVAGDPCCADARYRIRVEGTMVVNGWSRSGALWVEGTAQVTVTDGRLTVSNGWGTNNKINFIDIYSGSQSPPPTAPPMSTTVSTQPTSAINNSTDPIVSPT